MSTPAPEPLDAQPPLALQQLVGELRSSDAPKVRTALIELISPAAVLAAGWATLLELEVIHLGQAVVIQAHADGTPDIGISRAAHVLAHVRRLLPVPERHAPPPGGIWLRGLDLLLAKLDEPQRILCWRGLRQELPYMPPLFVALPAAPAIKFAPPATEWPTRRLIL